MTTLNYSLQERSIHVYYSYSTYDVDQWLARGGSPNGCGAIIRMKRA